MPVPSVDPADQKKAAIDAGKQDASAGVDRPASDHRGVKGIGTIVSATAATVTVTLKEPPAGQPGEIAATVSPTAEFRDGETKVDALPSLNPGDQVAFAASLAGDGSYELVYLEAHIPENPTPAADAVTPDAKEPSASVPDGQYGKALAKVVSVQPDSITLDVIESDLGVRDITAAIGPATTYFAGDQTCADPGLAPGQVVVAIVERGDGGTYTAQQIGLFPAGTA
jgi:hypothetical protein